MPVSWEQETPQAGALVTAYLLPIIENVAAIVAVIAFGVGMYALGQTMAGEPSVAQPIRRGGALARAWFGRRRRPFSLRTQKTGALAGSRNASSAQNAYSPCCMDGV
jgi:hypothetical protein